MAARSMTLTFMILKGEGGIKSNGWVITQWNRDVPIRDKDSFEVKWLRPPSKDLGQLRIVEHTFQSCLK